MEHNKSAAKQHEEHQSSDPALSCAGTCQFVLKVLRRAGAVTCVGNLNGHSHTVVQVRLACLHVALHFT